MSWFKRTNKKINTKTEEKKDIPAGLWYKTPTGKIIETKQLAENMYVSPEDDYHVHIGSKEYFEILFDEKFKEISPGITSTDFLKFQDKKKYSDRLKEAQVKTDLKDAIRVGFGKSLGKDLVIACMDFKFIGGSMGSVVGEKISLSVDYAIKKKVSVSYYFKIWWCKNDGICYFINANG
jgi:acetyl-CoA carboxylase carboxyl transferase subunit beta